MAVFFGVPNVEYIGGAIGIVIVAIIVWTILKRKTGRLAEEITEEKETEQLKKDEIIVEATQRDERKQCEIMENVLHEIYMLARTINPDVDIKTSKSRTIIRLMLRRLRDEKMSVKVALETFKLLHAAIDQFLLFMPDHDEEINRLVKIIGGHQQRYYEDLITEINMNTKKRALLQTLWKQFLDEEKGIGEVKAA